MIPVTENNAFVGMRVVRGKDWSWHNQDGWSGNKGTIITRPSPNKWVRVKWDVINYTNAYRVGNEGRNDLYVAENEFDNFEEIEI